MIYYLIALLVILVDQATKWLIAQNLELGEEISVIGQFFELTSHRNRGAAFSILQNQRVLFIVITTVVVIGIIWYMQRMIKQKRKLLLTGLGLVLGGAVGNFVDRTLFGEVVDFLKFHFNFTFLGVHVDYVFAIFNIADSAITIGVALILLDSLLAGRQEARGKKNGSGMGEQSNGNESNGSGGTGGMAGVDR